MTPNIYLICIGIGFIASSFFYFSNRESEKGYAHKYVFFIICYVLLFEMYANYLADTGRENLLVYNIFFVTGESILILLYLRYLQRRTNAKNWVLIFLAVFLVWAGINTIFFQNPTQLLQHYTHLLGSLGIVTFCCVLLYKVFVHDRFWNQPLLSVPHFWNVAAILLFYSSSFFYFSTINFLGDIDKIYLNILAYMNRFFAATLYIIFGLSFYSPRIFSANSNEG